jgi:methylated-DNA-[protein]-cysteine S-methyltransferase
MNTAPPDLDRRFRSAAAASGLLDVAYDVFDSPVGQLLVAASERGLCRISFDPEPDAEAERLARVFGLRVLRAPLDAPRRELDEYFEGRRREFELPIDLQAVPGFHRDVLAELRRVPYGQVTTYGTLAARAGRPRAARAVGTVMNRNPLPIVLPCHRVVGSTGKLVGYGGGLERKEFLLRLEGALAPPLPDPG